MKHIFEVSPLSITPVKRIHKAVQAGITKLAKLCVNCCHDDGPVPADSLSLVDQVLNCLYQLLLFEELEATVLVSKCMSHVLVAANTCLHSDQQTDTKVDQCNRNKGWSSLSLSLSLCLSLTHTHTHREVNRQREVSTDTRGGQHT